LSPADAFARIHEPLGAMHPNLAARAIPMNIMTRISRILSILCPLAIALGACPTSKAAVADSSITSVTVYADRAVVTRSLSAKVDQPGTVEVVLDRLPAALLDDSLRVAGAGTAQATLLDVTPRVIHVDYTPDERVKSLEDEIRQVKR